MDNIDNIAKYQEQLAKMTDEFDEDIESMEFKTKETLKYENVLGLTWAIIETGKLDKLFRVYKKNFPEFFTGYEKTSKKAKFQ